MPASRVTDRRMPGFSFLPAGMFAELMVAALFAKTIGGLGAARLITATMMVASRPESASRTHVLQLRHPGHRGHHTANCLTRAAPHGAWRAMARLGRMNRESFGRNGEEADS